jgi:hypothetical protein
MAGEPSQQTRILFVDAVDPLPLLDPTVAARFLKVRRHTLACYRHLGEGPAYYKLGRWIRYTTPDLERWAALPSSLVTRSPLTMELGSETIYLVDSPTAARFLTVTRHCLYNYREIGRGPPARHMGRRVYYSLGELLKWVAAQRSPGRPRNSL